MDRHNATRGEPGRKLVLSGPLILMAFAWIGPPMSQPQMRYNGGFTPSRRDNDNDPAQTSVPKAKTPAVPKKPRNFFPDSDFGYLSSSPARDTESSASSSSARTIYGVASSDLP